MGIGKGLNGRRKKPARARRQKETIMERSYLKNAQAPTEIDVLAILMEERQAEAARKVLAIILADHGRLLPIATAAGLAQFDFAQPDHRVIFLAITIAKDFTIQIVIRLAAIALQRWRMWDEAAPAGSRGMRWSWAILQELAQEQPPNSAVLVLMIQRLHRLIDRQRQAAEHLRRATMLLMEEVFSLGRRFDEGDRVVMLAPRIRRAS